MRRSSARATSAQPLDLDLPERKILLKPRRHGRPRHRAGAARRAPADRGVHDPRQCRGRRDAGEGARAADLPRARRAVAGEASSRCASSCRRSTSTFPKPARCGRKPSTASRRASKGRDAEQLVNEVVLRSQAQAEYAADNYGHFGLNLRRYAHFTSPIRRYADLIVHRALIRALKLGDGALPESADRKQLAEIAAQISASRAPRHGGRARDQRPADRAFPRRPHRRHLRRPHLRRHPRRPVRASSTTPAPTASCRRA